MKYIIAIVAFLGLLLVPNAAQAAQTGTVGSTSVVLSDPCQSVDPDHKRTLSTTITLTNNGTEVGNYDINGSTQIYGLQPGQSFSLPLRYTVPNNQKTLDLRVSTLVAQDGSYVVQDSQTFTFDARKNVVPAC